MGKSSTQWHQTDEMKVKELNTLTTLSSGTDRLNVHSWLLTKESEKQQTAPLVNKYIIYLAWWIAQTHSAIL